MIGLCNRCGRSHELDTSALMCGTSTTIYGPFDVEGAVFVESGLIAKLQSDNARLRALVERAYLEGHDAGFCECREAIRRGSCDTGKECWKQSDAKKEIDRA